MTYAHTINKARILSVFVNSAVTYVRSEQSSALCRPTAQIFRHLAFSTERVKMGEGGGSSSSDGCVVARVINH